MTRLEVYALFAPADCLIEFERGRLGRIVRVRDFRLAVLWLKIEYWDLLDLNCENFRKKQIFQVHYWNLSSPLGN